MTCQEVQTSLSLYLYGELDFAREENLENHLAECAFCQLTLSREKQWHTLANSQVAEPPLDLLAACRQQLRPNLARETAHPQSRRPWWRWTNLFDISATRWSAQLALASMLVFIGFASARWFGNGSGIGSDHSPQTGVNQMSLLNPASARIRDIQTNGPGIVRIVVDQESEITGRIDDANVRSLLLAGTRQSDPGVRFYSVQVIAQQDNPQAASDLRDVLFDSVRNDPNPAVRLEALEGLRHFSDDPTALETLKFVLEHDNNPIVRSKAVNLLVPVDTGVTVTPAMAQVIVDVMRSAPEDDYVRARCSQALREAKLPLIY
jgi:anti-sigma factor RsiW